MQKISQPITYIKLFFLIVITLAFLSLSYKAFLEIKNRAFRFETFNIIAADNDAYLISLNQKERSLVIFKFPDRGNIFFKRSLLSASIVTGVPIDGLIVAREKFEFGDIEKGFLSTEKLASLIFQTRKYNLFRINKFDLFKLFLFSKFVSESDRKIEKISSLDKDFRKNVELDLKTDDLFRDSKIFNQKISVEIINSTQTDGLGSRVSAILKNLGYNVIAVSNGNLNHSRILARKANLLSVERLEKIFNLKGEREEKSGIADVKLILSGDMFKYEN